MIMKNNKMEPYKSYYPDGSKFCEGFFENSKKCGKWQVWYQTGEIQYECNYVNGLLNGPNIAFYKNGVKKHFGYYKDGVRSGHWTENYENGHTKTDAEFHNGTLDGTYWLFDEKTGYISTLGEFCDGLPCGEWIYNDENNKKKCEGFYKRGRRIGPWIFYNDDFTILVNFHYIPDTKDLILKDDVYGISIGSSDAWPQRFAFVSDQNVPNLTF